MAIDPALVPATLAQLRAALDPMLTGAPGSSPLTQAAIQAWKLQTQPILQQQFQLQGLGHSPAVGQAMGESLAIAMPQFIQADMANRLAAAGMLPQVAQVQQGEENLTQSAARLAAEIANAEAARQLQAYQVGGNLLLGLSDPYTRAAQLQQAQQQLGLQAFGAGGELQRATAQEILDAAQAERLRQQGLSESMTTGLFGGSVLPPTMQQATNSVTKSKGSSK